MGPKLKPMFGFVCKRNKHTGKVIAIRREDQSVWERRAPLAPFNVYQLTKNGVKVIVQPSNRRAYPIQAYISAGAVIQEDISEASVVFGVKQVPVELLIPNKTYCMFSHTIKAQESNMRLLDAILQKNIRLIDYEKLVDENGQRVVAFGKYAGVAGMLNILHGIGLRLLALGHHTPFMHLGPAHNYRNSMMARQAIRDTGYEIALGMMPKSIGPLTFIFTGSGNVSQGAQELFQDLPHEYVPIEMLQKVAEHGSRTKLYGCVVQRHHYLERIDGGGYNQEEYEQFPNLYKSSFNKKIAPYASVIINGIYWAVGSQKLLTVPDAKHLLRPMHMPWLPISEGAPKLPHRLLAICDISADPGGSIEFMDECTTIDNPFVLYDAERHTTDCNTFKGDGVLICSIDNMPTQLPTESTDFFGNLMMPYALDILNSDATKPLDEHNFKPSVFGAIIASNGKLTPNFEYIQDLRNQNSSRSRHKSGITNSNMRRVLVLGAGYVSGPLIEYLNRDESVQLTVCSSIEEDLKTISNNHDGVETILVDVMKDPEQLQTLIKNNEVVVSLLPYQLHPFIASLCIELGVNMVTASYCTDEMMQLHDRAVEADITIVNEVGLDPGIDHLLAMECFDSIHEAGGKIESFVSYCGGLPAPEFSNNPLRYKFSWSPKSVLLNVSGYARHLRESKIIEIPVGGQLLNHSESLDFLPGFALEGIPNRDSVKYADLYGISAEAHTILRGSLRYRGFIDMMKALKDIGLIDPNPHPSLHPQGPEITWRQFMCTLISSSTDIFFENLKTKVADRVGTLVNGFDELGLLEDDLIEKYNTPLDTLSNHLQKKLKLAKDERDVIILHHSIGIAWPIGRKEMKHITLVEYGQPNGKTAMARTVGIPAAIATNMLLRGEIQQKGMVLPLTPDIYRPMLSRLRLEGLKAIENSLSF